MHSLYLWILTEVGLLGGIPFMAGIAACVLAAWKARRGPQGSLPLALIVMILFTNLTLTNLMYKTLWIIFALCAGERLSDSRRIRPFASPARSCRGSSNCVRIVLRDPWMGLRRIVAGDCARLK